MKNTQWLKFAGLVALVATVTTTAQADRPVTRRGSSVMHYMTRNALMTTDAGSNVVGWLRLQHNEQGHSSKQSLQLFVNGLEASTNYNLIAVVGDDTNTIPVAEFGANRKGRVRMNYMTRGQGRGGKNPLPGELTPLTDVRSIGIENTSTQTVAYAWMADAEKFQVLVKRNLTPEATDGTAAGQLSLIANHRKVHFRLLAGGLNATNDYHLAMNSDIVGTVMANEDGRVDIRSWPNNAPAVLELRSLALLDGGSNVVLSTTLPR
jgi:hypothetical protein